ncbi:MAG: tail fiber domain-containing protein, partial [Cytophagales bacterium]|nr:tail fiber domain-containing protein [Cytophagales bacterium]
DATSLVNADDQLSVQVKLNEDAIAAGDLTDNQTAAEVTSSATGNIGATNVNAAIAELESEKQPSDADLTTYAGITPSADIQTALGSADNATIRTNIGLGSIATQDDNSVAITGGSITGITDLLDADVEDALTVTAGIIENTPIGVATASTGRFTRVTVTTMLSSPGGSTVMIDGSGILNTSDRRLKENIFLLQNTIEKLNKLGGYNYNYKADSDKKKQIGVIAQELEKVFPELVSTNSEGYKMVNYQGLIPVLMEALKEQQVEINELNARLKTQESKLSELFSDNDDMKSDLELLKEIVLGKEAAKAEK